MKRKWLTVVLPVLLAASLLLLLPMLATGGVRWAANGVEIRGAGLTGNGATPQIISDGSGGMVVTWADYRSTTQYDIYAQHILANGTVDPAWPVNGREVRGTGLTGDSSSPKIISDGSGGAVITWFDLRSGTERDIYAQHVLANGTVDPAWPVNGREVRGAGLTGDAYVPQITSDGSGGAVITWYDKRSGTQFDIYAQHVLAGGTVDPAWPVNGREVRGAGLTGDAGNPQITSDGSGGAVITWFDFRSGTQNDIYAQHVLANGTVDPAWPVNGREVRGAGLTGDAYNPQITSNGSGGAVITWYDYRSGTRNDIYAQRVLAGGTVDPAWPLNGREIRGAGLTGDAFDPQITSDDSGGALITWYDYRSGTQNDIFAQRVLAGGTVDPAWPVNGREIRGAGITGSADDQKIASDGSGGAVITWADFRSGAKRDIYAQRVSYPNWYLAEGSTNGGMETFVLVQNPGATDVTVDIALQTDTGEVKPPALQGVVIPAASRSTFKLNDFVTNYNVSTKVSCNNGDIICERSMYGDNRNWAHDSIGTTAPGATWYLAEGSTNGGMETFVLVQNPGTTDVAVDIALQTDTGEVKPPALQGVVIPAASRRTFKLNDFVTTYNVSTKVSSTGGPVICERAMYGDSRAWAHDSIGTTAPGATWYLAEGSTNGGMETFVLVQNPGTTDVTADIALQTDTGEVKPPALQGVTIGAASRSTFKLNDYAITYNVSTKVTATGGPVICERAMYGNNRAWAHDSIGTTAPGATWYLAEGSTNGGMETFVLVQNPGATDVTVDIALQTDTGEVKPPALQGVVIPAASRRTFKLNDFVTTYNVSTMITATGGPVICERAMYGDNRNWAHDSIGYDP